MNKTISLATCAAMALGMSAPVASRTAAPASSRSLSRPWLNPKLSPEARARAAVAAMTLDEKLRLIFGYSDQALTEHSVSHASLSG
jgi:beta-glucosidase